MEKMKEYVALMVAAVLILVGLIVPSALAGQVDGSDDGEFFFVDTAPCAGAGVILFAAAAVCLFVQYRSMSLVSGLDANSLMMCGGTVAFGFFYGIRVAYAKGARTLENYALNWGAFEPEETRNMPEFAEQFRGTANTYLFVMLLALALAGFGIWRAYRQIKEDTGIV